MKLFLPLLFCLLFLSPTASFADNAYVQILRTDSGHPQAMQTSILSMQKTNDPSITVDLISAVHIGDKAYYQALNERFKQYDALLYELVAPPEHDLSPEARKDADNPLLKFQLWMKNTLGLAFQLEEVDYKTANFVHADVSPDEFLESMQERGETFPKMVLKILMASAMMPMSETRRTADALLLLTLLDKNTPERQAKMRKLLAEEFQDMDSLITAINGSEGSTLITARNEKAIQVLEEELAKGKKKIGIFYGAGHMPEFEEMLEKKLAFKRGKVEWLTAWDMRE